MGRSRSSASKLDSRVRGGARGMGRLIHRGERAGDRWSVEGLVGGSEGRAFATAFKRNAKILFAVAGGHERKKGVKSPGAAGWRTGPNVDGIHDNSVIGRSDAAHTAFACHGASGATARQPSLGQVRSPPSQATARQSSLARRLENVSSSKLGKNTR